MEQTLSPICKAVPDSLQGRGFWGWSFKSPSKLPLNLPQFQLQEPAERGQPGSSQDLTQRLCWRSLGGFSAAEQGWGQD